MTADTGYRAILVRYTAPQRGVVALMSLLVLLSIGLALVAPNVVRYFIVAIQDGAAERTLILLAILFLVVALLEQGAGALAVYFSEKVGWTATNMLRGDLVEHVLKLDRTFHESHPPGELIERIDGDVNGINTYFSSFIVDIVGNALLLISLLAALAFVDPLMGIWFTVLAAAGMVLLIKVSTLGTPQWRRNRQESGLFYGEVGEILHATEDIRSLGAAPYAMSRFYSRIRTWLPIEVRAATVGTSVWISTIALFTSATMLAYGLGGWLLGKGRLSLADLYLVVAYALLLLRPMEAIRNQLHFMQQAAAGVGRIRTLLAMRSAVVDGTGELSDGPLSVEFRNVWFAYRRDDDGNDDEAAVLRDFNLTIAPGRKIGLVGRTGAGKSTIANLVFRHYDPQAGEVRVGGRNIREIRLASLRQRIGLVTQDVHIFSATLRDNLTFFDESTDDQRLREVLGTLGMTEWLLQLPQGLDTKISKDSVSGGEAQLIAFARVFLKEPGLLILDEPSSSLDPATEALLERAMHILLKDRTVILIAHRLETLRIVDEVIVLEDGQIASQTPDSLEQLTSSLRVPAAGEGDR